MVRVLGEIMTFRVLSEDTDGAYSMLETITPPGGGSPPHKQHKDEETFVVIEGTYRFHLGDEVFEHGPGGTVFVPRGTFHAFQNVGESDARMLIINSPGGIHEQFFLDAGVQFDDPDNLPEIDMDAQIARIMQVAESYGIEIIMPEQG